MLNVYAVRESKLDCYIFDSEIKINEYIVLRRKRYEEGVLIFIKGK